MSQNALISITNKEAPSPYGSARNNLKEKVQESDFGKSLSVIEAMSPLESPSSSQNVKHLENNAIPEQELPEALRDFIRLATEHFQEAAIKEQLIKEDETLKIRMKFVYRSKWRSPAKVESYGYYDPITNTTYALLPDDPQSQEILFAAINAFHELRHRTSRRLVYISYFGNRDGVDQVNADEVELPLSTFSVPENPFNALEEIYVVGYVADNIEKIISGVNDQGLTSAWEERKNHVNTLTIEKIPGVESLLSVDEKNNLIPEKISGYYRLLQVYKVLKEEVPQLSELCISVRRGDKLAKYKLAKAIRDTLGRKVLAAISYCPRDRTIELVKVIQLAQEIKQTYSDPDSVDAAIPLLRKRERELFDLLADYDMKIIKSLVDNDVLRSVGIKV